MTALSRSGHFDEACDLAKLMASGWAASVTIVKCDAAFAEDMRAVLASGRHLGEASCSTGVAVIAGLSIR